MSRAWPPLGALLLLILSLEIVTGLELLNRALFPPPSEIALTLWVMREQFFAAFSETALATLVGYVASSLLGFVLAVLFSLLPLLGRAALPFAIFFQTVPIIAIAPLLVIYFGFGSGTVIMSALIVSIFPVLASSLLGLESAETEELELFRLHGATAWSTLWRLKIPRAYPSIYTGLKIAAGLSVIGAVAGEFVAGGGLGALVDVARTQQRLDIVYGAILLLSVLGLLLVGILRLLHFLVSLWRPLGAGLREI